MVAPSGPLLQIASPALAVAAVVLALLALFRAARVHRPRVIHPTDPDVQEAVLAQLSAVQADQRAAAEREAGRMGAPGLVHFSAYGGEGPPLSFSLALLDGHGDGVVVTSLYGRDQVRLYSKPLRGWTSEVELADEERVALDLARAGGGHQVIGHDGNPLPTSAHSPVARRRRRT